MQKPVLVVMIHSYAKLTGATPTARTTATTIASIFLNVWILSYEIPAMALPYNGLKLAYRFYKTICIELGSAP